MTDTISTSWLSLLGQFQARLGEEPIAGFQTRKVQALLVYLAVEPGIHPVSFSAF
jgi:hypothetical protein